MNRSLLQTILVSAITSMLVSTGICLLFLKRPFSSRRSRWTAPSRARLVAVPPLKGLTLLKARNVIMQSGLRLNLSRQKHSTAKEGTILLQYPDAGSSLRKGEAVQVIVSLGPRSTGATPKARPVAQRTITPAPVNKTGDVKIPWVTRMRLSTARARIRRAGLRIGTISYRVDNDVSPNWVLSQSPAWGTNVARGTRINLVVNKDEDD